MIKNEKKSFFPQYVIFGTVGKLIKRRTFMLIKVNALSKYVTLSRDQNKIYNFIKYIIFGNVGKRKFFK